MYKLIQTSDKTYYINSPAKIGIYKINDFENYRITKIKSTK